MRKKILNNVNRVVIKVGTSIIADKSSNKMDEGKIKIIADDISTLINKGKEVVLVSSGAIGAGMGILGLKTRPKELSVLQAAASIGQSQLMKISEKFFSRRGIITSQILLTKEDFNDRRRYINAKHTFNQLLNMGGKKIVPIVNENDTVAIDEIKFGDNDRLSALVAELIEANLLIILSDVQGLCSRPPSPAKKEQPIIPIVTEITSNLEQCAADTSNVASIGGMKSKIEAAKIVTKLGIPMVIAKGGVKGILSHILEAKEVGTIFIP